MPGQTVADITEEYIRKIPLIADIEKRVEYIEGFLYVNVVHGKDIMKGDKKDSDAYATIIFPDGKKVTTKTIDNTLNPLWK